MSNRRKIKELPPPEIVLAAESRRCPDCSSEVTITKRPDGDWEAGLWHDQTCPHWQAKGAGGALLARKSSVGEVLSGQVVLGKEDLSG